MTVVNKFTDEFYSVLNVCRASIGRQCMGRPVCVKRFNPVFLAPARTAGSILGLVVDSRREIRVVSDFKLDGVERRKLALI